MTNIQFFVIYLLVFRFSIIASGVVCIVLGYRLLAKGVFPGGDTQLDAKIAKAQFSVRNAAPGTCFAVLGFLMIAVMMFSSPPQVSLKSPPSPGDAQSPAQNGAIGEVTLRGHDDPRVGILRALDQAIALEQKGHLVEAEAGYRALLKMEDLVLNQLAWFYAMGGEQLAAARHLAESAAFISPENADFHDTLAEILRRQGVPGEALARLRVAAGLNPGFQSKLSEWEQLQREGSL